MLITMLMIIIRPYIEYSAYMPPITTNVARSVVIIFVCVCVRHAGELCEKCLTNRDAVDPRNRVLDGVKVRRIHSPPRGVTRRRCGFSQNSLTTCY